ncbi:hypothetical protein RB595_005143 [Gaeumannomyces hyphopodioides]
MDSQSKEFRVILALLAIKNDPKISLRAAAKLYNVPISILSDRRRGKPARCDSMPNFRKLTESEEEALIKYILELDSRAFPFRPFGVEDMANRLLAERDAGTVGKNWVANFVKRRAELGTRWIRKYDYQRAKCEDPKCNDRHKSLPMHYTPPKGHDSGLSAQSLKLTYEGARTVRAGLYATLVTLPPHCTSPFN